MPGEERPMTVRRVVTGQDGQGRAVFAADAPVEPVTFSGSGHRYYRMWGADAARTLPDDGTEPPQEGPLPPVGGFRFGIFVLSPDATADAPGIHATESTDMVVVLDGEVLLELDGGQTRTLRAGDTLVQNGTAHRWINQGRQAARLAVFTVGAGRTA
jgi:quercetin dioxygenase-like cupin family protein